MGLNDLEILAGDIQNYYLNAPTKDRVLFYAGDERNSDQGRQVVIVIALCVLKSSALAWRKNLSDMLGNFMDFKLTLTGPGLRLKPATASDGFKYYT